MNDRILSTTAVALGLLLSMTADAKPGGSGGHRGSSGGGVSSAGRGASSGMSGSVSHAGKGYHQAHAVKTSFGYAFHGKHSHWSHRCWSRSYGCWTYWCPSSCCSYYWCQPACCFYPVTYCPYAVYYWGPTTYVVTATPVVVAAAVAVPVPAPVPVPVPSPVPVPVPSPITPPASRYTPPIEPETPPFVAKAQRSDLIRTVLR